MSDILLVNVDPGILGLMSQTLDSGGYEVVIFHHCAEALDLLRKSELNLVIAGLDGKRENGADFVINAREISPDSTVMVISRGDGVDLAAEAFRLGADDYLYTPPHPGEMLFRVSSCLDKASLKSRAARYGNDLRLFRDLVESSTEAIAVSEPGGRIVYVNPAHERLFGRPVEVARTLTYRDYYPEKSIEMHKQEILPSVDQGDVWEGMVEAMDSRGRRFPLWQRTFSVNDEDGGTHYCFNLMHEFKERKAEKSLRLAQQAQALGTLAGGIAHEFNNILWIIMANTELATAAISEESRARNNLRRVGKACSRAADLVQQILSFSRQGEHRPKPFDIIPVVKESLKFLRTSLPATIEIIQNISTSSAIIMADPAQVHQILINLCTNAADAIGEKPGIMEISINHVTVGRDGAAIHDDLTPGKYLRLSVKDTGRGIEPGIRDRIFEPFFTTKGVGEGRGMGLAVVHGIVKSCEGSIEIQSEPGKGSTFHLFFPSVEKGRKPGTESREPSDGGRERILFVDDDSDIACMGKEILERYGYSVRSETDPAKALEIFGASPREFDLIITDMVMPNMTGKELAEASVRIRPGIPVILCTGYDEESYRDRAKEIGIKEVLMKPVNGVDLVKAIRKALRSDGSAEDEEA